MKCDFCKNEATYDGKTIFGAWAYMCPHHFKIMGLPIKGLYKKLTTEVKKDDLSKV